MGRDDLSLGSGHVVLELPDAWNKFWIFFVSVWSITPEEFLPSRGRWRYRWQHGARWRGKGARNRTRLPWREIRP